MLLEKYYAVCVRVPSGYPDVWTIYAPDEKSVRDIVWKSLGTALIGVTKGR